MGGTVLRFKSLGQFECWSMPSTHALPLTTHDLQLSVNLAPATKKKKHFARQLALSLDTAGSEELETAHKVSGQQRSLCSLLILCRQQQSSMLHSFTQVVFMSHDKSCKHAKAVAAAHYPPPSITLPPSSVTTRCCRVLKILNLCLGPCNQREQFKCWFGALWT